jgi:hypothetical protein
MSDSPSDSAARSLPIKGQEVSLGCGTLILIAVIVMIFSRGGTGDLEREIKSLRSQVDATKQAVDRQTNEFKLLRGRIEALDARQAEKPGG